MAEFYAEVKKEPPVPAPRQPRPRLEKPQADDDQDEDDRSPPPVPLKSSDLLKEVGPKPALSQKPQLNKADVPHNQHQTTAEPINTAEVEYIADHEQHIQESPKKNNTKKKKKVTKKLPKKIEMNKTAEMNASIASPTSATSQSNPFYDGIIMLDSPRDKPQSPKAPALQSQGTSPWSEPTHADQELSSSARHSAGPRRLEVVPKPDTAFNVYELAQAVPDDPSQNEDQSRWQKHNQKPLPPPPPRARNRDNVQAQLPTENAKPKQRLSPPSPDIPLDTIIVDKYFFNYLGMFRPEELKSISNTCKIQSKEVKGKNSREIELWFKGHSQELCSDAQENFIQLYQRVKQELWVESADTSSVVNIGELQDELENKYKCLCSNREDGHLEIVCQKSDLSIIRRCIIKHSHGQSEKSDRMFVDEFNPQRRQSMGSFMLPVGYDIGSAYKVYIYKNDITKLKVSAIVNAANSHLKHGGGVAKAILDAAGPELERASKEVIQQQKEIPVSNVVRTKAGELPSKWVFHAVGPCWPRKVSDQDECMHQLQKTFENVIDAAMEDPTVKSIAIPPISSGAFGVPPEKVATALYCALITKADPATRPQKMKYKEIHIVDIVDTVLQFLVPMFGQGGRIKAPSGKALALTELPEDEVAKISASSTSDHNTHAYREMIGDSAMASTRKKKGGKGFLALLGCGSKKIKQDKNR